MRSLRSIAARALLIGSVVVLAGCATSRGVLDYTPAASEDLGSGPLVRVASVTDARVFAKSPPDPSIPSLKGDEIDDKSITSRAIARKRNSYGKAMGDILLPEGRAVVDIARAAVVRGLREGGYRVVEDGQAGFEGATPIDVEVRKFWMWLTPGFWALHLEFRGVMALKGSLPPLAGTPEVTGYVRLPSQAAGTGAWTNTLKQGLEDFNANLVKLLQAPPATEPTATP